ncbi:PDxFFG protein [Mycoplasmopsis bovis]|uniref:PDxFFG protein n=1 Tax=Mycoplasmopsis bovis TaxID=28903 RepID=UPI001CF2EF1E|nr:PDxFFG protein [Mycoplasmopsis bovis]MCA8844114.1 PDxFFG protein [Mycoplasmopsis bovis]
MPKINLKKHVWHKYAISGGVLAGITTITLGAMYSYSKTSNEKLGRKNFTDEAELKNIFIGRNAKPKSYFLEVHNNKHKVDYDPLSEIVTDGKTRLTTTEYLDKYYAKHHALPYLNIKYGSFNFYNQYIEAVSPIEFYKFTEWFMKNVSWGPEIITLKSFSIVKGVEMAGNNITLGSHSNKNKEYTTIKFFPDAFFGTLPIYSSLSGRGNAQDSLTYKLNKSVLSEPELRKFLANIGKYNALANISNKTINEQFFRGITNVRYLKNQKVYALRHPDWEKQVLKVTYSDVERNRLVQKSPYLLIVAANSLAEAKEKFATKLKEYKDKDSLKLLEGFSAENVSFEEKIIANAEIKTNNYNNTNEIVDKALLIHFDDGSSYTIHNAFGEVLNSSTGQNGEKSFKNLNKYIQFDKALKTVKNLIEDLTSRFIEQIRTKFQPSKFSEKTLKNSLAKFSELNGLYREWLALSQIIENMESDLRNYAGARKAIEDADKLIKQLDEEIKKANSNETKKKDLEARKTKATADKKAAEAVINIEIFKKTRENIIKEREGFIKTLENNVKQFKDAINKASSDTKLKLTLEREIKRIEFRIKNTQQLNKDDKSLLNELKDVNGGKTTNGNNSGAQQKLVDALTKILSKNKERASVLLETNEKSGKITTFANELSRKFGIKTDDVETLNALVAMYDSFITDPNIDKLQSESFSSKNASEKAKLLKQVDKTVFETTQQLNRLTTGTNPTEQFVEKDYFATDVAYLPSELISVETLVDANTKAKLNWRDFYNLEEFVKDRKNILPDGATEFYAYSKFVNDQKTELSKKNAHLGADFDYATISDKRETIKKDLEKIDAEIAKFDSKVEAVKKLVAPYYENKGLFPEDFNLLYSDVLDPKTNKKNFDEFWSSNADVVLEYLTKALGDDSTEDNDEKTINGYIKKHSENEFEQLTKLLAENSQLVEKINSGKSTDDDKLKEIELGNKIRELRDKIDENDNHIQNKIARVINAKIDFQKAINLVKELKKDIDEYKKNIAKRYNSTFLMQLSDYQLRFLSSQNVQNNSKLVNAYKKLISSFNNSSAGLNKKVEEYIKLVEESKKQFAQTLSNKDYAAQYSLLKYGDKDTIGKKLDETQKTIIKIQIKESAFNTKWSKITNTPLKKALDERKIDDSKTLTEVLKSYADRVLALVKEFYERASDKSQSVYDQLKKKYSDDLKKVEDSIKKLKAEKASLTNKTSETAKINKLKQEIDKLFAESVVLAGQLEQLRFFKNWHKTAFNELNDIKSQIDSKSLPALHLLIPFNKFEAELSVFLNYKNASLESNLFKELNRLKRVLGELNTDIRTKIRPMVNNEAKAYFEAYETYLNYKDELAKLMAEKNLLQRGNQHLRSLKNGNKHTEYAEFYNNLHKKFEEDSNKNKSALQNSLSLKDDLLSLFENKAKSEKANVASFKKDLSNFATALESSIMNDAIVAKANSYINDIKKSDSTIASEMKKIKESENSSQLGNELNSFKNNINNAYKKESEAFISNFKQNIIVEQYKVLYRELKTAKNDDENESIDNKSVPEFLKKFENPTRASGGAVGDIVRSLRRNLLPPDSTTVSNQNLELENFLKALYSNVNGIEVSTIETFKKFVAELQKQATDLVTKILQENQKHKEQKDNFSNSLLKHFNTEIESIYKQINKDDYDNSNIVSDLSALSDIVSEFNKKFNIESSQNSELSNYVQEFNNLSKRIEEIVKELTSYKTLILGFLNNEGWETKTNRDISKYQAAWVTTPFIDVLKSDKSKLIKLTDYINKRKDLDETTKKTYLQALTAENFKKVEAYLSKFKKLPQLTPKAGTAPINGEVLFNSFVGRLAKVEQDIDKSIDKFGKYLNGLGEYFNTLIAPAIRDHKLYEAYNHSLAHLAKIVEGIRKNQLLRDAREFDKNVQAQKITSQDDVIVAKSKIELIDILTQKKILKPNATAAEIDKLIFKADISDIKKNGSSLEVTVKNVDPENSFGSQTKFGSKFVKFSVDANADKNIIKNMNEFFSVLGYKKMVAPSVIKEENEVSNPETGKSERSYDVFADAYEGLTDELLKEVPYAGEWLEGLHIKKSINSDGVMEYSLENGKYLGFTKNSRVGLWAILKMSDPNFKGISTDFLKFVGAHEYGHHITLNGAHDLSNKGSDPIFVSALTPNATPNINNYYSKDAVELYLKARTHVELGTKRLLDEFGALKDYGEYAEFRFAKKGKDGKITFDDKPEDAIKSMEKESDIWGVGLEDRDLWKALSNKNRRFLQDFAGMLEAVKNRREQNGLKGADEKWLSPFDMWVVNAIDYYSGTLNPTVNSTLSNAAKVKYMVKNDKGEYEFKEASLSMLKGIIKDGQGKLIEFEEVIKNGSKVIEPKVVEGVKDAEGNYVIINKVLMHNADGSPVLSVPLNVNLTDTKSPYYDKNAVKFVNDKINTIVKTIKSLIVDRFNINGWDTSDTRLSLDPTILIDYPETRNIFGARLPSTVKNMFSNIYKNYLANRDPDQGSYKKGKDGQTPFIKYYNKDGSENTSSNFPKTIPSNLIYGNPKDYVNKNNHSLSVPSNGSAVEVKLGHVLDALFNSGNSHNNNINGGAGQILWIDKDTMYMPNVKLETAFTDPFFAQSLPRDYLQVFNSKKIIKWLSKYTPTFITSSSNPNGIWNMLNSSGEVILFPDTSKADFTQVSKLRMNYTERLKRLDHNVLTGLFNSFASTFSKNGSIEFEDYKKWLEFVNVDLTKAKHDKKTDTVNWIVDYVKSKIDIEKFKKAYKTEIIDKLSAMTEMSEEEKNVFREFYKKASADSSNQMWANDIMRRFSSSLFAMFNSALTFDKLKNNKDAMWIFDQKHGYGEFKKQEFKIVGADRKKWEIGAEDTIKTYEKLAEKFEVDLKAITLVDSLVFDGKIQLYTDQTIVHVALQQYELVNIFTSLANAAFHTGPSNDVKNYFINKTERKFNELFSDYTYNFAEVINRDNLQITYSPSNHDFGNMPSFLSNISESNTGLEYVVDGTTTAKWKSKALKLNDRNGRNGITNAILDYERLADNEEKYKADALNLRYKKAVLSEDKNLSDDSNYNNSYFGEFQSINNGWFKDRWYRDFLGFKLYDDKGKEIVDDTIRIKDLEGKVVNTRARAYWQYYIQSQGVGKRNISGIWRDGSKDAVAMFGYLSSDIADKANYIAFKDKKTGEVKTLKITKDNTSNMFYYKTQNIENEKKHNEAKSDEERSKIRHTLADEQYDYSDANGKHKGKGFVSWVSDYGIMSKYRNALLLPGHTYSVYFSSDEQGTKDILNADLGQWESIAENGKTFSQASIRMAKSEKPYKIDENGNKVYEHILYVYDQFNGVK